MIAETADQPIENLLLREVQYKTDTTAAGTWRRFMYPNGRLFEEFTSHRELLGLPLLHYTRGRCPETGKGVVAKGIVAIGRRAVGLLAIGQLSLGLVAVGQLGVGVLFGLGQATCGFVAVGQAALGAIVGIGQFATGYVAVAQFGFGNYVLAQMGMGEFVWDIHQCSPAAEHPLSEVSHYSPDSGSYLLFPQLNSQTDFCETTSQAYRFSI